MLKNELRAKMIGWISDLHQERKVDEGDLSLVIDNILCVEVFDMHCT